ncbi:MAG: S8 family peptidase, partial [Spirochaetales bacterium]|nr:S8 family peptidase [Spirochaetales bacterium]
MMQKKVLILVFLIFIIFLCTVPAMVSMASEDVGNSQSPVNADLGIEVTDGLISMDVRNAEIRSVLQEIARKAKIELDISDDIDGKVTISVKALPLKDILKRLCENRAVVYQYIPEKKTCRIISVGAYSKGKSEKDKVLLTDKLLPGHNMQGQASRHSNKKLEFVQEERLYDSRGRLLYKQGEILVRFKTDATEKQIADLHKSMGNTVARGIARIRLQRIRLREGLSERDAIKAYMSSGIVEVAERHALRYADATVPNDEYFGDQWGLEKIRAPEAWDITTGNSEIIIAVIDTGVDYSHPDLINNIWKNVAEQIGDANGDGYPGAKGVDDDGDGLIDEDSQGRQPGDVGYTNDLKDDDDENGYVDDIYGWDFADNDADLMDIDGHGTHVAGIIAAEGNNGLGVAGVCWNAKIMVLKVQADDSEYMEGWDIIEAMHYAMDNGARIVNCSFGGERYEYAENGAIAELKEAGIIAVCAAGNAYADEERDNDIQPQYPASYELKNIIAVAASDLNDDLADFSNYGLTSVDVMAPGDGIKSTIPASSYTDASVTIGSVTEPCMAYGMQFAGLTNEAGITGTLYDCVKGYSGEFPSGVSGY